MAYVNLLYDSKRIKTDKISILRLPKNGAAYEFPIKEIETMAKGEGDLYWKYFLALKEVYPLYKSITKTNF